MTVEFFQELANKILTEYAKDREAKYGWTAWWPERTPDSQTVVFDYRAKLWEGDESRIFGTLEIAKDLTEEQARLEIIDWLKENIPD